MLRQRREVTWSTSGCDRQSSTRVCRSTIWPRRSASIPRQWSAGSRRAGCRIPRNRAKAARVLGLDESVLWPQLEDARARAVVGSEVLRVYPDRGAVPAGSWYELISSANEHVDVLVYAGLFLSDGRADLGDAAPAKGARRACRFGCCSAIPSPRRSHAAERGAGRRRHGRADPPEHDVHGPTFGTPGVEVRLHDTTLYNSIYRFDDDLLVNTHAYGAVAAQSPVMHLRRIAGGRLFAHYMASFERVWEEAQPLAVEARGAIVARSDGPADRLPGRSRRAGGEQPGAVGQRRRGQRATASCC